MKKIITLMLLSACIGILLCACSDNASDISVSSFESDIINRIPGEEDFQKSKNGTTVFYTRDNVKYTVEASKSGYIKTLTVTVSGADSDYLKNMDFLKITYPESDITEAQSQSINAVKYSAMPLKLLCGFRGDEDCIDTVLDAINAETTENGWKLNFSKSGTDIVFKAVYSE